MTSCPERKFRHGRLGDGAGDADELPVLVNVVVIVAGRCLPAQHQG
jgi:hypothetical protein